MSLLTAIYTHLKGDYGVAFTAVAATNVITAAGHSRVDGNKVRVSSTGTLPGGLSADTDYFVISTSGSTFKLSTSYGGSEVDITSTGSGTHSLGTAVSDDVALRIYPGHAPQSTTLPYVTFRTISSVRNQTFDGPDGLVADRIQFDIFGSTALAVEAVKASLRVWLDGFDRDIGSVDVRLVTLENVIDDVIPPQHGQELGTHSSIMDFIFHYAETIPAH